MSKSAKKNAKRREKTNAIKDEASAVARDEQPPPSSGCQHAPVPSPSPPQPPLPPPPPPPLPPPPPDDLPIVIDGSMLEGGGQVLRSTLSLAFVPSRPLRVHSIRAGRPKPGLANQHRAGARLCADLNAMKLTGDDLRSTEVRAEPIPAVERAAAPTPPVLVANATTSGATTLMLQASASDCF